MISRAKSLFSFQKNSAGSRYQVGNQTSQHSVSSILMSQLRQAYKEIEERYAKLDRSRISLKVGGADYFWLASTELANVKIPNKERMELQRICDLVKPEECHLIVSYFRSRLERCRRGKDVVAVFNNTVEEVIKSRPRSSAIQAKNGFAGRINISIANRVDSFVSLPNDASASEVTDVQYLDDQIFLFPNVALYEKKAVVKLNDDTKEAVIEDV